MSDVFDAYAKLAIERGLIKISQEAPKQSKELKKYMDDEHPRAGSDSIDIIESLYKIKHKDYKYDQNIMETAHPNKVIIAPAYDRMNALLENNIERQKIMLNIVNKPSHGNLTNHRYAAQDLMMTITKIANDMDNRNQDELRSLADTCLSKLHSEALSWTEVGDALKNKGSDAVDVGEGALTGAAIGTIIGGLIGAFGGPVGIVGGAAAGAALGGSIAALEKTRPQAISVAINAQIAKKRLDALNNLNPFIKTFSAALSHVVTTADQYSNLVIKASSEEENDDVSQNDAKRVGEEYQKEVFKLDKMCKAFLQAAERGDFAPRDNDGGIWDKLTSWESLVGTKLKDAIASIEVLHQVNEKALNGIETARGHASEAKKVEEFTLVKPVQSKPITDPNLLNQFSDLLKQFENK